MATNALVDTRINATANEEAATVQRPMGQTVSDTVQLMQNSVAIETALPFEPLRA